MENRLQRRRPHASLSGLTPNEFATRSQRDHIENRVQSSTGAKRGQRHVLATLLAEASEALQRRDYQALRCLSGVAPVTRRSGKKEVVLTRQAAHVRLRNAVYHWTRVAVQHDQRCRIKYAALRAKGHGHARALRSIADRLLAVACAMLQSQTTLDPNRTSRT